MQYEQDQDLEPLLTNQQNQLSLSLEDSNAIDGKALAILGANIAVIIYISQTIGGLTAFKYFLLYSPFLVSFILDIVAIWPRRYKGPGVDLDKHPELLEMSRDGLVLQLLANVQEAIEYNGRLNSRRLKFCTYSIVLTVLGFIILLAIL